MNAGKATAHALRRRPRGCCLKGCDYSGSGTELEGQVTTATPFAPIRSMARTAIGKPQLTPAMAMGQAGTAASGSISRGLRVANSGVGMRA